MGLLPSAEREFNPSLFKLLILFKWESVSLPVLPVRLSAAKMETTAAPADTPVSPTTPPAPEVPMLYRGSPK